MFVQVGTYCITQQYTYASLELKTEKRKTHLFVNKSVLLSGPLT